MSGISTHVLDTARGQPAVGIFVVLEIFTGTAWKRLANAITDENGRASNLIPPSGPFEGGTYRLHFEVATYFRAQHGETFYPEVNVTFEVRSAEEHYHLPLLLSPWGYTTYRGR